MTAAPHLSTTSVSAVVGHDALPEDGVLDLLAEHAAAHAARDVGRLLDLYAPDAVSYTLAPPLQQGPTTQYGTPEGVQAWFDTFVGPVQMTYREPVVHAGENLAFVHCLTQMTATSVGSSRAYSFWFRSTFGLRREPGRADGWLIVHRHESTPFLMDGSFLAALDLEP